MITFRWHIGLQASVCQEITGFPAFDVCSKFGAPSYFQSTDAGSWTLGYIFVRNHEPSHPARIRFKRFVVTNHDRDEVAYIEEEGRTRPGESFVVVGHYEWSVSFRECLAAGIWIKTRPPSPASCLTYVRWLIDQEDA